MAPPFRPYFLEKGVFKGRLKVPRFTQLFPNSFAKVFDFFRPIHFYPPRHLGTTSLKKGPLDDGEDTDYLPADLCYEAMYNGLNKSTPDTTAMSDELVQKIVSYLETTYGKFVLRSRAKTFEEVVEQMNLETSPGFPWYFKYQTKRQVLENHWDEIKQEVEEILAGNLPPYPHTATLKDEFRPKEKVATTTDKLSTRIFQNVALSKVIAANMLFEDQNDQLMKHIREHPITLGVPMPGPQFPALFQDLQDFCKGQPLAWDDDGKGWDTMFHLSLAAAIREFRKKHLPEAYHLAVDRIYDDVYMGFTIVAGVVVRLPHQKSGWSNTGSDNSLAKDAVYYVAYSDLNPLADVSLYKREVKTFSNGDDGMGAKSHAGVNFPIKQVVDLLAEKYRIFIEVTSEDFKPVSDLIFLSHQIVWRNFPMRGVILPLAGGNKEKLISALHYRSSKNDAINVARYYALVNALFAYPVEYSRWLSRVDDWVQSHPRYKSGDPEFHTALSTRLSEEQLMTMHSGIKFV